MTNPLTLSVPEGVPSMTYERELDAPPEAVLEAHRDPQLVRRWLGPSAYEMDIETWDFASQGRYRYTHRSPQGAFAFRGTFHTVRPDLVVQTFEFEGVPDVVALETLRIEPLDDGSRTRLTGTSTYPSVEARDGAVASGMEGGMRESFERLDDVLGEER